MSAMASQITWRLECFLNRLFGHRSKKTSKLRVTGLCVGNSPVTGEFPAQMASNAENVSIWWRVIIQRTYCYFALVTHVYYIEDNARLHRHPLNLYSAKINKSLQFALDILFHLNALFFLITFSHSHCAFLVAPLSHILPCCYDHKYHELCYTLFTHVGSSPCTACHSSSGHLYRRQNSDTKSSINP